MSKPIVFDTSLYILSLRQGDNNILQKRQDENMPLWLSAVVLEELYVGASGKNIFENSGAKFENEFTKINRLLVPNQTDWSITGQILNKIGEKHGFEKVGKARLTNDTLLAMSIARAEVLNCSPQTPKILN